MYVCLCVYLYINLCYKITFIPNLFYFFNNTKKLRTLNGRLDKYLLVLLFSLKKNHDWPPWNKNPQKIFFAVWLYTTIWTPFNIKKEFYQTIQKTISQFSQLVHLHAKRQLLRSWDNFLGVYDDSDEDVSEESLDEEELESRLRRFDFDFFSLITS